MTQLTTAQRIVIGFAIAPLALVGLVFYALHEMKISLILIVI